MNVYLPNLRLPSAYQEVEYIQSSGTQYINTNLLVNWDFTSEIKYAKTANSEWNTLIGTRDGSKSRYIIRSQTNNSCIAIQRNYNNNSTSSVEEYDNTSIYNNNNHIIKLNRYVYIDWNLVKTFSASTTTGLFPYPLYVFALNVGDQSKTDNYWYYKLYYMKIWDSNNNLIRDFVPCYRKSDNVIWLYDLVNSVFYTNAWTGTFSKGNDVTMSELKNDYIGEYIPWTPDASRTLLYLPLESNATDQSWNSRSTSPSNITYANLWWIMCANGNGSSSKIQVTPTDIVVWSTEWTVSMLVYYTWWSSEYRIAMNFNRYGSYWLGVWVYSWTYTIWGNASTPTLPSVTTNSWVHISYTVDSSWTIFYINWTKVWYGTKNTSSVRWNWSNDSNWNQYLFCSRGWDNNYWKWWIREVIIEKRKRSAEDVSKYYQRIKAKLWF